MKLIKIAFYIIELFPHLLIIHYDSTLHEYMHMCMCLGTVTKIFRKKNILLKQLQLYIYVIKMRNPISIIVILIFKRFAH